MTTPTTMITSMITTATAMMTDVVVPSAAEMKHTIWQVIRNKETQKDRNVKGLHAHYL